MIPPNLFGGIIFLAAVLVLLLLVLLILILLILILILILLILILIVHNNTLRFCFRGIPLI